MEDAMNQYVTEELVNLFINTWNKYNADWFPIERHRINYGCCYQFAYLMKKLHGDIAELHGDWGHAWVKIGDKLYDSDHPQGTDCPHNFKCGPRFPESMRHNVSEQEFIELWSRAGSGPIQMQVIDEVLAKLKTS
jgi:hypothetical protein